MIKAIILDLDGTVYRGDHEVPGAGAFVRAMHARGIRTLFATNRSNRLPGVVAEQLQGFGIECGEDDILTSSQATAELLAPGRAYCIGEVGLTTALREAGHTLCDDQADYVIVGFDSAFTYDKLATAVALIHAGARFVATNPDRALKLETGMVPGTGALVAAVEAGSGKSPLVIGKPERHFVDIALRRLALPPEAVLMLGDNLATDIAAGAAAGTPTALILTGISTREEAETSAHRPDWIVADYPELLARMAPFEPGNGG